MDFEVDRAAAFRGRPLLDELCDVEDRAIALDHEDHGVGVDLVVHAEPLACRLAVGRVEADTAGVAVGNEREDDVVDRLLEPDPVLADVRLRVVRHRHDLLTHLLRRPGDDEGEIVAEEQVVERLAGGTTFVGLAVAVVVDVVVTRLGRVLVQPEAVDLAVTVGILRRVVAVAPVSRIALGNFCTDAHGGHFLRQAVTVLVAIEVNFFGQAFIGMTVAVVVDAVADLHGVLVHRRVGLVAIVAECGREAVAIQVTVDLLGGLGLGGRGRSRRVDSAGRLVGRTLLVVRRIEDTVATFAGTEGDNGRDSQKQLEKRIHLNFLSLAGVLSCLTELSARPDSTLPAGRFFC